MLMQVNAATRCPSVISYPFVHSSHSRSPVRLSVVRVEGSLRVPLCTDLQSRIQALLGDGELRVLLDLSRVTQIDAAGVGELVRVFNTARAAGGILQIGHASSRVEHILRLCGLWTVLNAGIPFAFPRHSRR